MTTGPKWEESLRTKRSSSLINPSTILLSLKRKSAQSSDSYYRRKLLYSNSPQHKLAQWLMERLNPIKRQFCKYYLKDSFGLLGLLDDFNVNNSLLYSFDVSSLFMNVPLHETIDILCNLISITNCDVGLPVNFLRDLLILCTENLQFKVENEYFRQIDGIAMGCPLGPFLADIFMSSVENKLSHKLSKLLLYCRYVDNILLISHSATEFESLLAEFNNSNRNIILTCEKEVNDSIAFSDIFITRRPDGTTKRLIYRKPTWSRQHLNFHSFSPSKYKANLIRTLFYQARKICTDDSLSEEVENLVKIYAKTAFLHVSSINTGRVNDNLQWLSHRFQKRKYSQDSNSRVITSA